jgi:polyisoprenyl-phosphate glycosyltransferase
LTTLDVVCPVFNEASVIREFHRELRMQLDALHDRYRSRIIFVVDRSTDGTEEVIQRLCEDDPTLIALFLSSRFGHQAALVAGMDHSTADWCVMMDCDLEHPPSVIPAMLEKGEQGFDIVYTVRRYPAELHWLRRIASSLYYRLINSMTNLSVQDGAADFRLISRRVRDVFTQSVREQNQFLRGLISWMGFRSASVVFSSQMRRSGVSKYHLSQLLAFAAVGIVSFSRKPLRLAIYASLATAAVAALTLLFHLYAWFRYADLPQGWPTLALLISLIGSVQLLVLGIIGEYVGLIFEEVKRRPLYIVDRAINADEHCHQWHLGRTR